jgi:hypothetical protein
MLSQFAGFEVDLKSAKAKALRSPATLMVGAHRQNQPPVYQQERDSR